MQPTNYIVVMKPSFVSSFLLIWPVFLIACMNFILFVQFLHKKLILDLFYFIALVLFYGKAITQLNGFGIKYFLVFMNMYNMIFFLKKKKKKKQQQKTTKNKCDSWHVSWLRQWNNSKYSRTSIARTFLGPCKFVLDMGISSHWGLI